ncbi:MAG: hypothetical protein L6R38_008308, partial [Xanthoria sp. 2 TBL-2021]
IAPGLFGDGKERAETASERNGDERDSDETATGATGVRELSKRTADKANLDEGMEDVHKLEKVRRRGQIEKPESAY